MKIREFMTRPCELRKDDPTWKFALGASPTIKGVILQLVDEDGIAGFGYAGASPHMGSIATGLQAELDHFKPHVLGQDANDIAAIMTSIERRLRGASQAKAAIDCALHDLLARRLNVPVHQLFGGKFRDVIPVLRILAIKSPEDMAAQASKLVGQGYRYLKIKVMGDVTEDVARVAAIRRSVGDDVHLTVDANQSYSVKDAIAAISKMAAFAIDLVEQPVHADDFEGLCLVTKSVPVTVEADEAAGSLSEVYRLATARAVDAISLKVPKLGGLRNTLAAAHICEQAGISYRLGAAVGSRLLAAHALHIACSLRGVSYACELGEFSRLLDDPFTGLDVMNGEIRIPDAAGFGVRLVDGNAKAS
jgi:L-alanine-DL-glutamate epimerase-like enolase superfamily enzyme